MKYITIVILLLLLLGSFYLGTQYNRSATKVNISPIEQPSDVKGNYSIRKGPDDPKTYPGPGQSYKYELIKTNADGSSTVLFSLANWFGFEYYVSKDEKFIAIITHNEAAGDESFILLKGTGEVVKDFGHFEMQHRLIALLWTEHNFWISDGEPIIDSGLAGVIVIDADTLKVERFNGTIN